MPNTREKLIELLLKVDYALDTDGKKAKDTAEFIADYLIANGVTFATDNNVGSKWIPVSEPPKENGYYLCVILFSAVGNKKEYGRKILFWEDNVWIEMANCFRTVKPLYWMPMAELPQPPKGE